MPYIIGTAGHIDHGKTSLVKALTGQDTDRLKEEKERGISIDLGFAHLDLPDGTQAGVVDVPGHERFIRNMLAGAHGIDLVLFTVAADDGVMPQTEEHLDILHLLGIQHATFVITKADQASAARIDEVKAEIQLLTAGTSLDNSPIVPFSSVTGQGLSEVRALIEQTLRSSEKPKSQGYFRLPVDRVFVLQGHGLIVTGTALGGEVHIGDRVRCLPGHQTFRVRSLQVHNQPVEVATRGQRVALNLSGQEKPSIERGHVICDEQLALTSNRFDAWLELRPTAAAGIKNHQRVRVHLGTAERLAKLILLGPHERLGPKQAGYCQVVLSEPLLALRGDHYIVRDETAQRTLGGGVVIHPWPKKHKKGEPGLGKALESLHRADIVELVEAFLTGCDDFAVPASRLKQFLNQRSDDVRSQLERTETIKVVSLEGEPLYTTVRKWQSLTERLLDALRDFHAAHPLAPGRDMEELRDRLTGSIPPRLFRAFVAELEIEGTVARDGSLLRLPGHQIRLRDDERALVERIKNLLSMNPLAPPDFKQLELETGIERARFTELIRVMERDGSIVRVANDLCFLSSSLDQVKRVLHEQWSERSDITPAMFRDLFGTTRKYTIPLLEYFDREGVTIRVGDGRRLKSRPPTATGKRIP